MKIKSCFLIACFFLSGCLGGLTPQSRFYAPATLTTSEVISTRSVRLAVQDVSLPSFLERPQIVLKEKEADVVRINEFERWSGDPAEIFQSVLIDDLRILMPHADVLPLAYGDRERMVIKVNIDDMMGQKGKNAILNGVFRLIDPKGNVLAEENFAYQTSCGFSVESYVSAQSLLWADLAQKIAQTVSKQKR